MASFFEKLIGTQAPEKPKPPAAKKVLKKSLKKAPQEPARLEVQEKTEEQPKTPQEKFEKKPTLPEKDWPENEGQLAIDVYQTEEQIVIQATVAGVKPQDLEILIENGIVTIKGSRQRSEIVEQKNYLLQECHWGSFSRQFVLPSEVDPSRAEATLKEGILTIRIPKIIREKVTRLTVR